MSQASLTDYRCNDCSVALLWCECCLVRWPCFTLVVFVCWQACLAMYFGDVVSAGRNVCASVPVARNMFRHIIV